MSQNARQEGIRKRLEPLRSRHLVEVSGDGPARDLPVDSRQDMKLH